MTTNTNTAPLPTTCTACSNPITKGTRASSHGAGQDFADMHIACYEYAQAENSHQDEAHGAEGSLPDPNCPVCMADTPLTRKNAPGKAQGKHISHTGCYAKALHDKSKDGRQACRDAELWKTA
jgi:hypothetical protein